MTHSLLTTGFMMAAIALTSTPESPTTLTHKKERTMEIDQEIIINKPIEEVWEILGNQYSDAYKWASGLYHSEGYGRPVLEGTSCSSRACETSFGNLKEEIRVFDAENYQLSYEVMEGFPSFVKSGVNNWYLTEIEPGKTKVDIRFRGVTTGLMGAIMRPVMKRQLSSTLEDIVEDFRHYVETGMPSPHKVKDRHKHADKYRQLSKA